jgi:alkanesulfonate monooxygenase SsuD/methylene tetrahydromethanopterin reductase-like flavin-dependent oxidoreductase (luciferase family)
LGVGAAGAINCHTMTGVPNWSPQERSDRYREWVELLDQLLENEETNYEGQYYQAKGALMNPRPVQKPHPPLHIAAHGPKALRLAATYGDGWNSYYPGKDLTPKEASRVTGRRNQMISEFAQENGRDPGDIRRLFTFGWTADKPFASREALFDAMGRYHEAGIREFVFFYTPGLEAWKDNSIITFELLDEVGREIIPALRKQHG